MNNLAFDQTKTDSDIAQLWKTRFAAHGHTGWANRFIYEFDQQYRLLAFSSWLGANRFTAGRALDFGCGTGDFSRLLVDLGWTVTGYDRYVQPRFTHPRFEYLSDLPDPEERSPCYDLIISITVLDHIKDDDDFLRSLLGLRRLLKSSGSFFFLERSPDSFMQPSLYQAFRSIQIWRDFLGRAGLRLDKTERYFNPEEGSIPAWEAYRKHPFARIGRKLLRYRFERTIGQLLLRKAMKASIQGHGYASPSISSVNILTGHPV